MSTISTTLTSGVALGTSGSYTSPLTITANGAIEAGINIAIFGPAGNAWAVDNVGLIEGQPAIYIAGTFGTVINSGTIAGGVYLAGGDGGSVGNTGLIEGDNAVESANGAGTVTNSGTIAGTGTHGSGISLDAGGSVGSSSRDTTASRFYTAMAA